MIAPTTYHNRKGKEKNFLQSPAAAAIKTKTILYGDNRRMCKTLGIRMAVMAFVLWAGSALVRDGGTIIIVFDNCGSY